MNRNNIEESKAIDRVVAASKKKAEPTYRVWNNDGDEILPGDLVEAYGQKCRVYKVLPMGTIDVEAIDGSGRRFRISGLWMAEPAAK